MTWNCAILGLGGSIADRNSVKDLSLVVRVCSRKPGAGEAYLGSLFYPEIYADMDLEAMVQDYYQTFYRVRYSRE